jgi:hypothetical protein
MDGLGSLQICKQRIQQFVIQTQGVRHGVEFLE